MNAIQILGKSLSLALLAAIATTSLAIANQLESIDIRSINLKQRINTEFAANTISAKDRRELMKMYNEVKQHQRKLKSLHKDVLTIEDDKLLDQELNAVSAKLDALKAAKQEAEAKKKTSSSK